MKSLLAAFLILSVCLPLAAKTIDIPEEHLSIDIPNEWTSASQSGTLLSAADANNNSGITVASFPNTQNQAITPGFIAGMEKGMVEQGPKINATVEITARKPATLNGIPSYSVQSKMTFPNSKIVYVHTYPIAVNGKYYVIALRTLDADKDPELQTIANSFRFTTPPTLPDPSRNSLAYKLGQVTGFILFWGILLAAISGLIAMVRRKS